MRSKTPQEKQCMNCGVGLGTKRDVQLHCDKSECVFAWGLWSIKEHSRFEGDHQIWEGALACRSGIPQWMPSFVDESGYRVKRSYRVLDAVFKAETGQDHPNHLYKNDCGVHLCITVAHNHPVYTTGSHKASGPSRVIKYKLPAEPLLRELDRQRSLGVDLKFKNKRRHDVIGEMRKTGLATVTQVDTICIDYLRIHPAVLYGDLFFTVGTEDVAA